ncbi:MAG: ABC transporter permease [Chloroflexi bacterium]|nr:ABC transporter permease [Chloroflexota bacterium]
MPNTAFKPPSRAAGYSNTKSSRNLWQGSSAPQSLTTQQQKEAALQDEVTQTPRRSAMPTIAVGLFTAICMLLLWWGIAAIGNYPAFILPTPLVVGQRMWAMLLDGSLLGHFWTTTLEAGLGFLVALLAGIFLGYLIAHSVLLERLLSPYLAVSQGLPVVALAPLLVLWVQDDLPRKVVIVALIVFFPILVNTIVGVRSIERSMLEVARMSGANLLQTIYYVELPLALRPLLGGVRLGLMLSITGAVVGEFVSSGSGLGFLLMLGRGLFDTTLVFVGLVALAVLAILAYATITLLEKALITWEE